MFDGFIVFVMTLEICLKLIPDLDGGGAMKSFSVIRLLRIARLARVVRLLGQFKTLWLLVQGLLASGRTLLWTVIVIGVVVYIFSILGMELIAVDPDLDLSMPKNANYNDFVGNNFDGLWETMLTIFLLGVTMDNIGQTWKSLILVKPWLFGYFLLLFLVVSLALLNLVMALMVETAMAQAADDLENQKQLEIDRKKEKLTALVTLFRELDVDGSGNVDKDEIMGGSPEVLEKMGELIGQDDPDEIVRIFEMLDYDNSGELTITEFCSGLMQLISGLPLELNCLLKQCKDIRMCVEKKGGPKLSPLADAVEKKNREKAGARQCTNCYNTLAADAKFCRQCGQKCAPKRQTSKDAIRKEISGDKI